MKQIRHGGTWQDPPLRSLPPDGPLKRCSERYPNRSGGGCEQWRPPQLAPIIAAPLLQNCLEALPQKPVCVCFIPLTLLSTKFSCFQLTQSKSPSRSATKYSILPTNRFCFCCKPKFVRLNLNLSRFHMSIPTSPAEGIGRLYLVVWLIPEDRQQLRFPDSVSASYCITPKPIRM